MQLSSNQRKLLRKLLESPRLRAPIESLADRGVTNVGALSKALQATGVVLIEEGVARLELERDPGPFEGYGASRLAEQLDRNGQAKDAAAEFAADLLVRQLHGVPRILIDNGTQAAAFFRALTARLLRVPAPQQPRVSWALCNPIVASYVMRMPPIGEVHVIGGDLNWDKVSFEGPSVLASLAAMPRIEVACLGVARASSDGYLGQPTDAMTEQKRLIIQKAEHVIVLLDDSKLVEKCAPSSRDVYATDGGDHNTPTIQRILESEKRVTIVIGTSVRSPEEAPVAVRKFLEAHSERGPLLTAHLVTVGGRLLAGNPVEQRKPVRRAG